MSETYPPTEDPNALDRLLGRGRTLILGLIDAAQRELARRPPGLAAKVCRQILRDYIAPAEAALRRAIFIIAATLPAQPAETPRPPAGTPARLPPPRGPVRAAATTAPRPVFRLTEPDPGAPRSVPPALCQPGNAPAERRSADPFAAERKLIRRLTALSAAAEDPVREAARWLRHRAREHAATQPGARPATHPARHLPIDYFGLPARVAGLPYAIADLISHLNDIAFLGGFDDTS